MSHDSPRALIFDSGLGGLSVFQEIAARLPGLACVYAADTAFFPYGTKAEEDLVRRLPRLLTALAARYCPDIAVIACNTASTVALPPIRVALSQPVVGTVPAIKPAARLSRSRVIGLLGTPGTVRRAYTDRLIDQFAGDCRVLRHGSAELVALAEEKLRSGRVALERVRAAVAPLWAQPGASDIDVLVLACTHFPLLREELQAVVPTGVTLIDSGEAIARRVADLLPEGNTTATRTHVAVATAATHGNEASFEALGFARVDLFDAGTEAAATVA